MRILFVCNPLHGHVNPMLPLARAAHNAGHAVVVATGADIAPLAQRDGLSTWSVGMTHAQAGGDNQASWLDYFEASARARIAHLAPRCAAWHPDMVIHEETELAGPVVAARIGVRSVVHGLGPMLPVRLLPWVAAAIERLELALDRALTAGAERLDVVHGLGTGAVRRTVHQYLSRLGVVQRYALDEGNAGVTHVWF